MFMDRTPIKPAQPRSPADDPLMQRDCDVDGATYFTQPCGKPRNHAEEIANLLAERDARQARAAHYRAAYESELPDDLSGPVDLTEVHLMNDPRFFRVLERMNETENDAWAVTPVFMILMAIAAAYFIAVALIPGAI